MKAKPCVLLVVLGTVGFKLHAAAEGDGTKLATANNPFAFKLLDQLSGQQPKDRVIVSANSAAEAAVMNLGNSASLEENPPKPFEMIVDRPFLFTIVDARSEMILFMGLVNSL